jgi:hypothetical protein
VKINLADRRGIRGRVRADHRIAYSDDAVTWRGTTVTTPRRDETWRIIGAFVIVSVLLSALIMTL